MNDPPFTGLRKVWQTTDGVLMCEADDTLYRSIDDGIHWDKLADPGKWQAIVDARGMRHWIWVEREVAYPHSLMRR